ncbi:MAG: hypothetical protein IPP59_17255 [Betaproteobacteria bacterium]|nr:hypothetical protein [Candidatus Dechloromonas phosphorivorans]
MKPRIERPPFEQSLEEFVAMPAIKGAAHAWTKKIFSEFGKINENVLCEDQVIPFRAYLLSRPRYLDEKLIKYRRMDNVSDRASYFRRANKRAWVSRVQYLKDLTTSSRNLDESLRTKIANQEKIFRIKDEFWSGGRLSALRKIKKLISTIGIKSALLEIYRRFGHKWFS